MRALLDTNVVLDALLGREPWTTDAGLIWAAMAEGTVEGLVGSSSILDVYYLSAQTTHRRPEIGLDPRRIVRRCLDEITIINVDRNVLEWANAIEGTDFEDDLILACAEQGRADAIVTRDPLGFPSSSIPIRSPAEFLDDLRRTVATKIPKRRRPDEGLSP